MASPKASAPWSLEICEYVTLHSQRDFSVVKKLRFLKWEIILDYPGESNAITRVLVKREQKDQSERGVTKKAEVWNDSRKRPQVKGCKWPLDAIKRQENGYFLGLLEGTSPLQPPKLQANNSVLFKDTKFIIICYINNRKLIQKSIQFNERHFGFNSDKICVLKSHFVIYLLYELGLTTYSLWSILFTVICT